MANFIYIYILFYFVLFYCILLDYFVLFCCCLQVWMHVSGAQVKMDANPDLYNTFLRSDHDPEIVEIIEKGKVNSYCYVSLLVYIKLKSVKSMISYNYLGILKLHIISNQLVVLLFMFYLICLREKNNNSYRKNSIRRKFVLWIKIIFLTNYNDNDLQL